MQHDVFGEISYDADEVHWSGVCTLPAFAEFGRAPHDAALEEPDENFRKGIFPLTIAEYHGNGPSAQQAEALRYLQQHELEVRQAVMTELLVSYRTVGSSSEWLKRKRNSRTWGWLARWLVSDQFETVESLRPAVRCTGVELSNLYVGPHAFIGFDFETAWEFEHGVAVVYHPTKGVFWGDETAITTIMEADNINEM